MASGARRRNLRELGKQVWFPGNGATPRTNLQVPVRDVPRHPLRLFDLVVVQIPDHPASQRTGHNRDGERDDPREVVPQDAVHQDEDDGGRYDNDHSI